MNTILLLIILFLLLRRDRHHRKGGRVTLTLHNVRSDHTITILFKDREKYNG